MYFCSISATIIDTLISYAEKLKIEALVLILKCNKENKVNTYIHLNKHL